ncbi:MAG: phage head spike fiber domain-containing protein [Bacteroidota bacterium]
MSMSLNQRLQTAVRTLELIELIVRSPESGPQSLIDLGDGVIVKSVARRLAELGVSFTVAGGAAVSPIKSQTGGDYVLMGHEAVAPLSVAAVGDNIRHSIDLSDYYTRNEINLITSQFVGLNHTHDDRYYTKGEAEALIASEIGSTLLPRRWVKTLAGGETLLSGDDDASNALAYEVGGEWVYLNGVLLVRGADYSAADGSTVSLAVPAEAGDVIQIFDQAPTPGNLTMARAGHGSKALRLLDGEEGLALDFRARSAAIVDFGFVRGFVGRPDDLLSVSRASQASYFDRNGVLQYAANNVLRYDHDPITGAPLGLLIEGAATNIALNSQDFGPNWNETNASVSSNVQAAPDATMTADKLVESNANGAHHTTRSLTIAANTLYTFSVFIKAGERTKGRLSWSNSGLTNQVLCDFDLTAGTITNTQAVGSASSAASSIKALADGWYRISLSGIIDASTTAGFPVIALRDGSGATSYTGDNASGFYIWGAQVELGGVATSYIATAGATATRNADAITLLLNALPFNTLQGTLVADVILRTTLPAAVVGAIVDLNDGSDDERIGLKYDPSASNNVGPIVSDGGTDQVNANATATLNSAQKHALAWRANNFAYSLAGAAPVTDSAGTLPSVTTLCIGGRGDAGAAQGIQHLRSLMYLSRRVTNTELQALAT